jgi:hypothetical protein
MEPDRGIGEPREYGDGDASADYCRNFREVTEKELEEC